MLRYHVDMFSLEPKWLPIQTMTNSNMTSAPILAALPVGGAYRSPHNLD